MNEWTASLVKERLEEAAQVLRRLPPVKVQGYFTIWPHILHDVDDKKDWEDEVVRRGPPDAASISRMEETLAWFRLLAPEENSILWMRARKEPWKTVCAHFGYSRTVAWERWVFALAKLAYKLNLHHCEFKISTPT